MWVGEMDLQKRAIGWTRRRYTFGLNVENRTGAAGCQQRPELFRTTKTSALGGPGNAFSQQLRCQQTSDRGNHRSDQSNHAVTAIRERKNHDYRSQQLHQMQQEQSLLLLLRPSPLRAANLAPTGSQNIASDLELVRGLVPASVPKESRYVLRTLRAGYVHLYIKIHLQAWSWMDYQITDQSDVVPDSEPLFSQPSANISAVVPRTMRPVYVC